MSTTLTARTPAPSLRSLSRRKTRAIAGPTLEIELIAQSIPRVQRRAQELAEQHRARRQEAAARRFSSQPGTESAGSADRSASTESRVSATPALGAASSAEQESDTLGAVPSGKPSAATLRAVPSGTLSSATTMACSDFAIGKQVGRLGCRHVFRLQGLDIWVATQTSQRQAFARTAAVAGLSAGPRLTHAVVECHI